MILDRPDLDGLRLIEEGRPDVWLMYHGKRHRIASPAVYDSLFSEVSGLVTYPDVSSITLGPDVIEGSCLIRADETVFVHLLTASDSGEVRRHWVPTYESLLDFGFAEAKVRDIPHLAMELLPKGADLVSAADRSARR